MSGIIFVTVGNGKFDPLIKEIDRLKGEGKIKEKVITQIGLGTYKPKNCEWFTFHSPLDQFYEKATLVIGHGGPGTVFEILRRKKKLITLPNRDRTDPRHQVEYLRAMDLETDAMIYCDHVEFLESSLEKAKTHKFTTYAPVNCEMHNVVENFIKKTLK